MFRILIADDHDIVRRGVRDILVAQPGWEVCGEAADGREAVEIGLREKPDIAILDVSLPLLNGIGVTRQLRQALPKLEVLLFTMHDDEETVSGGLAAGARGYLRKTDFDQHLVAAVSALGAHRPYFSSAISELVLNAALHERSRPRLESFHRSRARGRPTDRRRALEQRHCPAPQHQRQNRREPQGLGHAQGRCAYSGGIRPLLDQEQADPALIWSCVGDAGPPEFT